MASDQVQSHQLRLSFALFLSDFTSRDVLVSLVGTGSAVRGPELLGLAALPFLMGLLADRLGLIDAMHLIPLVSVAVIVVLLIGRRSVTGHAGPSPGLQGAELPERGRTVREG